MSVKEKYTKQDVCKALALTELYLRKAYAPGTIRDWKGGKYIKGGDGKWKPYSEGKIGNPKEAKKPQTKVSTTDTETHNIFSGSIARGDIISFTDKNGNELSGGEVQGKGRDGVTVIKNNVVYQVEWSNIKNVEEEASKSAIRDIYDKNEIVGGWRDGSEGMQPKDDMKELWAECEKVRDVFKKKSMAVVEKFKDTLNPSLFCRPSLKGTDRAKEKLQEDEMDAQKENKYGTIYDEKTDTYHCKSLRDIDGHTLCVKNVKDVEKLLRYYNSDKDIIRIKNNFAIPSPVGYSDINMNIRLPNGTIAEVQLNTMANVVAKENYGHALFEIWRTLNPKPEYKEKYKDLINAVSEGQKSLYTLSNEYSKKGNFPSEIKNPYGASHKPYEDAIIEFVKKAKPLFDKADKDGVFPKQKNLNTGELEENTTKLHFNHLCERLGIIEIKKSFYFDANRYIKLI